MIAALLLTVAWVLILAPIVIETTNQHQEDHQP